MATIQKRTNANGKVSYKVTIKRGLSGERIYRTFQRKRDAEAFATEQEGNVDALRATRRALKARKALAEVITQYVTQDTSRDPSKESRLSWWAERYGNHKLADFTDVHVSQGLDQLEAEGRAPGTINRYHTALSACLQWAKRKRWVSTNVAREVERRSEPKGRTRWLNEDERRRLFDACEAEDVPAWYAVWVLTLVTTGMRRGEATKLTWADVDLDAGVVHITHTKTDQPRAAPLMPHVVQALRGLRDEGARPMPSMPVFPMSSYYQPDHLWKKVTAAAELDGVRQHDLRHTAASILAQSNASDLTIAALLGHSTLQMVKRYSHLRVDAVREQMEKAWGKG